MSNTDKFYPEWNDVLQQKNDFLNHFIDLCFNAPVSFSVKDGKVLVENSDSNKDLSSFVATSFPEGGIPWIIPSPLPIRKQIYIQACNLLRDERIGRNVINPRALARIWHGIPSESYTSILWSNHPQWGIYREYDFYELMQIAEQAINGEAPNE